MSKRGPGLLLIFVLVVIDQVTKALVAKKIAFSSSVEVVPGFLNLTRVHNRGAIFGFFSETNNSLTLILLYLASFLALSIVIYYYFKVSPAERLFHVSLSLILAGALGNLIDRLLRGYVIDFLDFYIRDWHWPSFNVADSSITLGGLLLLSIFLFQRKKRCSLSS